MIPAYIHHACIVDMEKKLEDDHKDSYCHQFRYKMVVTKNKNKIYLPFLLGLACAAGLILGSQLNFTQEQSLFSSNSKKEKLNRLIDYIEYEYVDEVNTDSIVDVTVNKILENLDPHSVYIPKKEYASVTENMNGDFVGIGVSFYQVEDTIVVIQPMKGGPSEKIGIKGGDRILYAND
ncbi:hypothetical protein LCGC14_2529280, partial [marine sediment metagenome]